MLAPAFPALPASTRFAAACFAFVGLCASGASAQSDADRATARSLGGDGQQALDSKDYKTAEDRFRRAESLVQAPTLLLGLARALAGEGKYVEAQETYNRIVREGLQPNAPDAFKRALTDAKREVESVSPKIAGVTIVVHASGGPELPEATVMVILDGAAVNGASLGVRRSVDPGSHVIQASAVGYRSAEVRFDVAEGASVSQGVTLEAAPAPPAAAAETPNAATQTRAVSGAQSTPSGSGGGARPVLPWVAFGAGGAGLAVGAIAGAVAMGKHSDLAQQCPDPSHCTASAADIDSYHTVANVSTIGFVVCGAGVAAGVLLLLTQPRTESAAKTLPPATGFGVDPVVGLGWLGAHGRF
jgi:hypothetical protein